MWDRAEPLVSWMRRSNGRYFEEWATLYKNKPEILSATAATTDVDAAGPEATLASVGSANSTSTHF
jgi:hypothetical protein